MCVLSGAHSSLDTSVLGRNVSVGAHVTISDSHIWNNVTIEDGAVCTCVRMDGWRDMYVCYRRFSNLLLWCPHLQIVESSILCEGVMIKSGARVGAGSILSYNVVIGKDVEVKPYARVWRAAAVKVRMEGGMDGSMYVRV